ncbi:MAG: hypothetical protein E6699_31730, partial [Bradyrhizobium sp.]|uniref:hypothetical protein n=1 Tax=Bradyrhizobium sp. TaxID=376 RepID=UPI002901B9BF
DSEPTGSHHPRAGLQVLRGGGGEKNIYLTTIDYKFHDTLPIAAILMARSSYNNTISYRL